MTCSSVTPRSGLTCYSCRTYFKSKFKIKANIGSTMWSAMTQDFKQGNRYPTLSENEVCYTLNMYSLDNKSFYKKGTYSELKNGVTFDDIKAADYYISFVLRLCSSDFGININFAGYQWGRESPYQTPGHYQQWNMINTNIMGNVCKRAFHSDGNISGSTECPMNEISGYTIPVEEEALTIFEANVR